MSGYFSNGDSLRAVQTGSAITVKELLGAGGQGEVYRVDYAGSPHALKWYFPHTATKSQRELIEQLVEEGTPGDAFLWPMDLVESDRSTEFGYVMPLREKRFELSLIHI